MKKVLAIVFLLVVIFLLWKYFFEKPSVQEGPKQEALKNGNHSENFNKGVNAVIYNYLDIKSALVEADTNGIKLNTRKFLASVDSMNLDDLKKDTSAIYTTAQAQKEDIKANAVAITEEKDVTEMRKDFKMVSENLYPFLKTIGYEGPKLYWQNCPMAFGEGKDASWLSNTSEIVNPYLGKNHPEFKGTMLHCGETKDSLQ